MLADGLGVEAESVTDPGEGEALLVQLGGRLQVGVAECPLIAGRDAGAAEDAADRAVRMS